MNVSCIDAAILSYPFEVCHGFFGAEKYKTMLCKAFEFYEASVQKGMIRSYGISGHNSFRQVKKPMLNG
jgi:predicted aldo/keto reductase-like oxidoreductase